MSIEDHRYNLIHKIIATDSKTVYIKMDRSNILEQLKDGNKVLIAKVKEDSNSVQLFRGLPEFIGEDYAKEIPPSPRSDSELHGIRETTKACLYSLIRYYRTEAHDSATAYIYCQFMTEFDKAHYNHFVLLGQIAKDFGDTGVAKESFEQAMRICRADLNWPKEFVERITATIEKMMQNL